MYFGLKIYPKKCDITWPKVRSYSYKTGQYNRCTRLSSAEISKCQIGLNFQLKQELREGLNLSKRQVHSNFHTLMFNINAKTECVPSELNWWNILTFTIRGEHILVSPVSTVAFSTRMCGCYTGNVPTFFLIETPSWKLNNSTREVLLAWQCRGTVYTVDILFTQ